MYIAYTPLIQQYQSYSHVGSKYLGGLFKYLNLAGNQ